MPAQQLAPIRMGLPPVFTSFTMSVFRPMADIAITIKNLLSCLKGENTPEETPRLTATVVIRDAPIKYRIKKGKIFFNATFLEIQKSPASIREGMWKVTLKQG